MHIESLRDAIHLLVSTVDEREGFALESLRKREYEIERAGAVRVESEYSRLDRVPVVSAVVLWSKGRRKKHYLDKG